MKARTQQPDRAYTDVLAGSAFEQRHDTELRQGGARTPKQVHAANVDAQGLEAELRRHIRGEVRSDDGSRALYATDGSN
jgi:hypothetical protein